MPARCFPTLRLRRVRATSVDECGVPIEVTSPLSEVNTLTEGGTGLTSYTITIDGQTTASIDDDASPAVVQAALEALSNVVPGDVVVTGTTNPIALTLTWGGNFTGDNVAVSTTPTGGTGTVVVATVTQGGTLVASPLNVVTDGTISLQYEEDYEEGDEFIQKNGWGDLCINDRANSVLKRAMITVNFCYVDPELFSIILGADLIVDGAGNAIGYRRTEGTTDANFALEGWVGVPGQACTGDDPDYGYIVFPFVTDIKIGGVTFENGTTTFEMNGWTRPGVGWGVGPYDVYSNFATPTPVIGPLSPAIGATEHYRKFLSNAPLPTPACGFAAP